MTVEIICVGKLKEKYWQEAAAEYIKRLGRICNVKITELPEVRLAGSSAADEAAVISAESQMVAAKLAPGPGTFTVALAVKGRALSSEDLAEKMAQLALDGKSRIVFVIGGSLGLSDELIKSCDMALSFSAMTFPHQLMRVVLLEQIYRAFKINAGETYHK